MDFTENPITVEQVNSVAEEMFQNAAKQDILNEELKLLKDARVALDTKMTHILESCGKGAWKTSNGSIEVRELTSVQTPKTPEAKKALFEWLQSKGIFWETVSINANSLNALYKSELEAAQSEGKDFVLPGIEPAKTYSKVYVKPKRG